MHETDPVEAAIGSMRSMGCSAAVVLRDGRLAGLVTAAGIAEMAGLDRP
ncbi:MAG: hypothetical protein WCK33_01325 [Phycisphaerae bacterium]